jgi:magnesium chelatase family protein
MAQKLPIPVLAGNSYEISSLSLTTSKGYGFRFNNLPQGNCRSTIDKLLRVLDHFNVRIPLKRITISSEIPISTKHFSFIELSLFMLLYILKYLDISNQLSSILFLGRVDLHGNILPLPYIDGWLLRAKQQGIQKVIISSENFKEPFALKGIEIMVLNTVKELIDYLKTGHYSPLSRKPLELKLAREIDVIGQDEAKRALELALVGNHHTILSGNPGIGKTSLCESFLEIAKNTFTNLTDEQCELLSRRDIPFQKPATIRKVHQNITSTQLMGGGVHPYPGEVSLAHEGILYIDEIGSYRKSVLELIKIAMEQKSVTLNTLKYHKSYMADFTLIGTTNGSFADSKLLTPSFLDRVDFQITLFKPDFKAEKQKATYVKILKRVNRANQFRKDRLIADPRTSVSNLIHLNSFLIEPKAKTILQRLIHQKNYSIRAIERSFRIARTIADFEECEWVSTGHLSEAISLRGLTN